MGKKIDIKNQHFGMLTVLEEAGVDSCGFVLWKCLCKCGNIKNIRGTSLRQEKTKSCGCLPKGTPIIFNKHFIRGKETILYDKKGKTCLIDTDDLYKINNYCWHEDSKGYWVTTLNFKRGKTKTISLHKILMNSSFDGIIDHINRNPSDNRKKNLRIATSQQNVFNRSKNKNNTSGYKGVTCRTLGKWDAGIKKGTKQYHLGSYSDIEDAIYARNYAELLLFKEYGTVKNFIHNKPKIEQKVDSFLRKM